jgi:hypothetical protein
VASAQATIATMPITNLQDPQPRRRARLMGSSATITADLGAEVPVDCVALISTTLGAGAMVQARLALAKRPRNHNPDAGGGLGTF